MSERWKAAAWSAATTFLATVVVAFGATSAADVNVSLVSEILFAALVAAGRTLLAAVNPNMPLYGYAKEGQ